MLSAWRRKLPAVVPTDRELSAFALGIEVGVTAQPQAERDALRADAERYRWLCSNNFDRQGPTQIHTWLHTWEPHSQTGEPTEWMARLRGGALDAAIDAARKASE